MKDLDPLVLLAVFQEMLGPILVILIALAGLGLATFVWTVLRERALDSHRLVRSELAGLVGGVLALVLTAQFTVSGFTDAGGPVDWLLVGLIWGIGLAGTTIMAYGIQGVFAALRGQSLHRPSVGAPSRRTTAA